MKTSGVYAIRHLPSGRCYIGSSVHISGRWADHLSRLRRGIHHCAALQAAWNLDGPEAFGWQILETIEQRCDLIPAEQRWLDDTSLAYNASRRAGGGPRDGFRHTAESKQLMSDTVTERWKARGQVKLSAAHREALRQSNIGRKKSPEELEQMRITRRGRVITWGAKISAAKKGKSVPWTPARRAACRSKQAG